MNPSFSERERLETLISRLKGQLAELEDAYALTIETYKKVDLSGYIAEIRSKIRSYEKKLRSVRKTAEQATPENLKEIKDNVEKLKPEVEKGFDKSENQFEKIGYLPSHKFKINKKYFKNLLTKTLKAELKNQKGKLLEELAAYLFNSCGDLFEITYSRKLTDTHEIDRVVFTAPGSFFREWGDFLIVECKNTKQAVNTKVIDVLVSNIRGTKSRAGVLFSMRGVTSVAKINIRENYLRDDIIIIVIDQDDLQQIAKGVNFIKVLWDKYKTLRFS
jgi:hypothetical protein